jgi:hypothetical protein
MIPWSLLVLADANPLGWIVGMMYLVPMVIGIFFFVRWGLRMSRAQKALLNDLMARHRRSIESLARERARAQALADRLAQDRARHEHLEDER